MPAEVGWMVPAAGSLVSARKAMGCAQWANRESVRGMFRTHRSSQHSALGWRGAELEKDTQENRGPRLERGVLLWKGRFGFCSDTRSAFSVRRLEVRRSVTRPAL